MKFELKLEKKWFDQKDILVTANNISIKLLEEPYRKWYKMFFQIITFNLYKAPWQYKCKIIPSKDEE